MNSNERKSVQRSPNKPANGRCERRGPLDAHDSAALAAWLKTSPVHVEEFLGVSAIARDLRRPAPILSTPRGVLARVRAEDDTAVQMLRRA